MTLSLELGSVVAIVAARGGSKRLPRKNIGDLGGVPLIGWSLAAARAAGFDEVFLTTEDEEIAEVGRKLGFQVPYLRPSHLAADTIPAVHSVLHLLDWINEHLSRQPQVIVLLPPTAPFRTPAMIIDAVKRLLSERDKNRIFSVARLHVPAGAIYDVQDGTARGVLEATDRRVLVHPTGAIFAARVEALRSNPTFIGEGSLVLEHAGLSTIDIDTPEDWALATAAVESGRVQVPTMFTSRV